VSVRILQFGTTGQLGIELTRQAAARGVELVALSRGEADFVDPEACAAKVAEHRPDLVVIAAAFTAVDQAESERELAFRINAETPGAIAHACQATGAAVVGFSSDYVFAGEAAAPYREDDETAPLSAYGASKLAGEAAILSACERALVLRTSWLVSAHGKNFVKTMLRLAAEGRPLRVVDDQSGRPTAAADLAGFVLDAAEALAKAPAGDPRFGLFHFANAGETTWRRFAEAIFEAALGREAPSVQPITTAEFPTPARRPRRGALDTGKLERVFGYRPRPWREALAEIAAELKVAAKEVKA
jgi:dTDP-4-dehydrorhamnose reductase